MILGGLYHSGVLFFLSLVLVFRLLVGGSGEWRGFRAFSFGICFGVLWAELGWCLDIDGWGGFFLLAFGMVWVW